MLRVDHNDGVLLPTIDRESAGNAINGELADAFASALDAAAALTFLSLSIYISV